MEEVWRDIKGYEGIYQVSNLGRVKSLPRKTSMKKLFEIQTPGKLLTPHVNGDTKYAKYLSVGLWKDNKPTYKYVHRLVAEAFILNPENKPQVNHKDLDPFNNSVDNLEWVSASENIQHAKANGRLVGPGREVSIANAKKGTEAIKHPVRCVNTGQCYSSIKEAERSLNIYEGGIQLALKEHRPVHGLKFERIEKEELNNERKH